MSDAVIPHAHALVRFGLNSPNASRLTRFYERAFGAQARSRERRAGAHGLAECTFLELGDSTIELLEFDYPGRPYPHDLPPCDNRFQHLAIAVTDMKMALERLSQTTGWTAISTDGPQQLPESAGGVTAFKFSDPDGHPLEFLEFPHGDSPKRWKNRATTGVCRGIDHSALSVVDVERSVKFYGALGLRVSLRTFNHGLEQQRLDGVSNPLLDVIGLVPPVPTPHVELLHYHTEVPPLHAPLAYEDTAATRLIFQATAFDARPLSSLTQDPDGHFIEIAGASDG